MLSFLPPMGWNSWNTFGNDIDEKLLYETIDIIASEPYKSAGYNYVVIDDCWENETRDENGRLSVNKERFPSGIKALADYAHSKGLKLGIYSCAGVSTCEGRAGSYDHEYEDARTFAEWGIDYLKYDYCYFPSVGDNKNRYLTMSMALRSCGRDILFSACNWGKKEPWNWMRSIGAHIYRSDDDIRDNFGSTSRIINNQIDNIAGNGPGCWNDLDMLTIGMNGKGLAAMGGNANSYDEYVTQFAFWCITSTPLIMGCDVRKVDEKCKALLCNKEMIAINQDPEGRPAYVVQGAKENNEARFDDTYILMKLLSGGEFALGFFNMKENETSMRCIFPECGIPYKPGIKVVLRDVISGEDLGKYQDSIKLFVKGHGCRLLRGRVVFDD